MEALSKNKIKLVRSLKLKKNRDKEGLFIVEGLKMVEELITLYPNLIDFIVTTNETFESPLTCYITDPRTIKELSSLNTAPTHLAVVSKPTPEIRKESHTILALDSIQDPGNMGTIIRTADWFGIQKIVCSNSTVDIFNPKVIQSSMGSLFRVKVEYVDLQEYLSNTDLPVYGALLEGENLYNKKLRSSSIIVMGNEGQGISEEIQACITESIHIPRIGSAESLNVSIATAVILGEFSRSAQ